MNIIKDTMGLKKPGVPPTKWQKSVEISGLSKNMKWNKARGGRRRHEHSRAICSLRRFYGVENRGKEFSP